MASMSCKSRYSRLESLRLVFLDRARRCSELTIPTLIPPQAHSASTRYYTPWQGIGAQGVNNLASKLLLSLLPPNSPFFRLSVDDFTLREMSQDPSARSKIEEGLNKIERAVQNEIEGTGLRSPVFLALKYLIVAGNALVYLPKDGGARVFRLDSYVVQRDHQGNVQEIIAKEVVSPESLPEDVQAILKGAPADEVKEAKGRKRKKEGAESLAEEGKENDEFSPDKEVELYTHLYRDDNQWRLYQSVEDTVIEGSEGAWPLDKCPMIALRWTAIDGEDYGRSYVEEYLGDMISLEGLSRAIVEGSAVAAKVVYLLNPNGVTRLKDLSEAESGAIIIGTDQDVSALQSEKQADMSIAYQAVQTITDRLMKAFLMAGAVQRNAERVTAEEIRLLANELEDALGGVYSILSQEFQLPLVTRLMDRMTKQKRLPALPKGVVKPVIVTGLEALGRGHDLNKYQMMLQALQPLGPQVIAERLNVDDYIKRVGTSLGIDMDGLIKSAEQLAQEQQAAQAAQQQQQMAEMAKAGIPNAVKGVSDMAMQAPQPPQAQ